MNERMDKISPMIPVILPVFENWFSEAFFVHAPCRMSAMIAGINPQPHHQQRMSDAIPHDILAIDKPFEGRGS